MDVNSGSLPRLDRDGVTVHFDSNRAFSTVHDAYLAAGMLPVWAPGAEVGGQRKLKLRICSLEIAAELEVFGAASEDGVALFELVDANRHRGLLAALARDVPLLM